MTIFKRDYPGDGSSNSLTQTIFRKKHRSKSPKVEIEVSKEEDAIMSILPRFLRHYEDEASSKFQALDHLQNARLLDRINNPDSMWALNLSEEALTRNRYGNIAPWDLNRVHLQVPSGVNDYINASPIVLERTKTEEAKHYIATQGPKRQQAAHLWRMISEQTGEVAVIVMLTKPVENNREKCFEYYPKDLSVPFMTFKSFEDFGEDYVIEVELQEIYYDDVSRADIRKILLTVDQEHSRRSSTASHTRVRKVTKTVVWHLLFKGWPDYHVPQGDDKKALLELIKLANERNLQSITNPLTVHCSAGVGRSGTFIALDHLIRELRDGSLNDIVEDPVFETTNLLREQRMHMVQSDVQYEFIYEVLKERLLARRSRRMSSRSPHPAGARTSRSSLII